MNDLLLMCTIAGRNAAIPALRVQTVLEIDSIPRSPARPISFAG